MANANDKIAELSASVDERLTALMGTVETLAKAALTPRPRATRVAKEATPVSELDGYCQQAGFRVGSARRALFVALYGLGSGEYPLSQFEGVKTSDANVVSRRLARKGMSFELAIDGEERGNAVLIFTDKREVA